MPSAVQQAHLQIYTKSGPPPSNRYWTTLFSVTGVYIVLKLNSIKTSSIYQLFCHILEVPINLLLKLNTKVHKNNLILKKKKILEAIDFHKWFDFG